MRLCVSAITKVGCILGVGDLPVSFLTLVASKALYFDFFGFGQFLLAILGGVEVKDLYVGFLEFFKF